MSDLTWTRTAPTVPGWYWRRVGMGDPGWIDSVFLEVPYSNPMVDGPEVLCVEGSDELARAVEDVNGEWAGPIPPPVEEPK